MSAAILCLVAAFQGACATVATPVDFDAGSALPTGRGLLLLDVDSNFELGLIDVGRVKLRAPGTGQRYLLYELPAGDYGWRDIEMPRGYYGRLIWRLHRLVDGDRRGFHVAEGEISYAGHIRLRRIAGYWLDFGFVNRSSLAMDHLSESHADLLMRHRFRYTGFQRDDFPAEYQSALRAAPREIDAAASPSP